MTSCRQEGLFIFMVDDDREDIYTMRRAFSVCTPKPRFDFCSSGEELFDFYVKAKADGDLPDLLVLDLNLPKMDGIEILRRLRQSEGASERNLTPVMVLSTSSSKSDVVRSYGSGANAFFTKSNNYAGTKNIATSIVSFWQTSGLQRASLTEQPA